MAKIKREYPKGTGIKHYWCRPGNHGTNKLDLAVQFGQSCFGICRACVKKQTEGKGLQNYWIETPVDH